MWYNKYIDIPYVDRGRDSSGLDCWGLVRLVYSDRYNIELPSFYHSYNTVKDIHRTSEVIAVHKEQWNALSTPEVGCVVLFRIMGHDTHVGVYIGDNKFLHIRPGTNSAIESLDSVHWNKRISGYYKYNLGFKELTDLLATPHPLKTQKVKLNIEVGTTLQQLNQLLQDKYTPNSSLIKDCVFLINGGVVDKQHWSTTTIQVGDTVEYRAVPRDGDTFRLFAFVALAIVAGPLTGSLTTASGTLATSLGVTSVTGLAVLKSAVTAGIMLVGSALINAIAPIRPPADGPTPAESRQQLFISGATNSPQQYSSIPVVLGKMKVTPPLGAQNHVRFSGDQNIPSYNGFGSSSAGVSGRDTYVDMLLIWGYGPLDIDLTTLKIGQVQVYKDNTLTSSNFDNLVQVTLDRKTEPSSNALNSFNAIYGSDVQGTFPNLPLSYSGLPPIGSNIWAPVPRPTSDTGWVEAGFSQPTDKVSISISFPQGLRSVVTKGSNAGTEYAAPVGVEIQYRYNSSGTWSGWLSDNGWGHFTIGGQVQATTGTSVVTRETWDSEGGMSYYPETVTQNANTIISGGPIADAFTWTITRNRSWPPSANLQVRIRRTTGDETEPNDSYRYSHQAVLQTVTSYSNTNPAVDPPLSKLAKTALTLKATDEISGQVDGINAVVQTVCLDWDQNTGTWVTRATSNPASLFRYVLQHPANAQPVPDSQINLLQLQAWHNYCNTIRTVNYNGSGYSTTLQYNSILGGSPRSVLEVLRDISAAGRASPTLLDGKWSVVIDQPKTEITQHFSPHNSWGFEGTKLLPKMPQALKVEFFDRSDDYKQKQVIVAYNGVNPQTAQLLESIQLPGVTSIAEAIDHAKWHLAQIKLRPEVYTINVDLEYLVCNRGDRVKVTHDVPQWGSGSGRVKNVLANNLLELDEEVLYDPLNTMAIRVRNTSRNSTNTIADNSIVRNIATSFGVANVRRLNGVVTITLTETHPFSVGDSLTLTTNIATFSGTITNLTEIVYDIGGLPIGFRYNQSGATVATTAATGTCVLVADFYKRVKTTTTFTSSQIDVNDLVLYGVLNKESQDLMVIKIEPTTNKNAVVTLVDYGVTDYGVTDTYNIFTDYQNLTADAVFQSQIYQPPLELANQVGDSVPEVLYSEIISDERVIKRLSPGVYSYLIRIPYRDPPNLNNDVAYVRAEVSPIGNLDTSGGKLYSSDITIKSIDITGVQENQEYRFRLRYETKGGRIGTWTNWYGYKVVGRTTDPSPVSNFNVTISTNGIRAQWDESPDSDYSETELRSGSTWDESTLIVSKAATSHLLPWQSAGTLKLWAVHYDSFGLNSSNEDSTVNTTLGILVPSAPVSMQVIFGNSNIEASWTAPVPTSNQQPLDRVELSWSSDFGGIIDAKKSETANFGWKTAGSYTLYARYVDVAGNIGAVSQATLQILNPLEPVMTAVEIQVNAVTLRWQDAKTSQPIRKYAIYYGDSGTTFNNSVLYGSAGADSRSDIIFFRSSGSKVIYIVAEDVAGNLSDPRQITVDIKMPNNFVLATEYYHDWQSIELVNATIIGGSTGQILLPSFSGRTWEQRLTNNGWSTAAQKVTAGFPVVTQPVPTSGKHVEYHDVGKVLPTAVVKVTPTVLTTVAGATPTIRIRGSIGDTAGWQAWLTGTEVNISNFRYLEVEYSVTSDGKGFVELDDLYVRIEISEVNETATLALSAGDTNGTLYTTTKDFLDVQTVQATPLSSNNIARLNCIVDDNTLPAKVYVQAWDTSNNRTGGTVSLLISGV
jgi:hypothetical protein